jgi:hypothetical protein
MLKLNRNKIYEIGKENTVKIQQLDKQTNKIIETFEVYKSNRRRNKLFLKSYTAKLKLVFSNINYAKKYNKLINDNLKDDSQN